MSYEYKSFTLQIKLEHIAKVKTCQILWRQRDVVEKVIRHVVTKRGPEIEIIHYMISKKLNKLVLPPAIKKDLEFYIESMGHRMLSWLTYDLRMQRLESPVDDAEQLSYFINNFTWDDFGCVDGKQMLESYVSTKESIDFFTWCQLCYYCSEDYIRKFSSTVSWSDCERDVKIFPLFWHYKIHGNFPNDPSHRYDLRRYFDTDLDLNEKMITEILLLQSMREGNTWCSQYCWSQLEEQNINPVIAFQSTDMLFNLANNSSIARCLQFLELMNDKQINDFLKLCFMRSRIFIMEWPWILCIPSWRNLFSRLDSNIMIYWQLALDSLNVMSEQGDGTYKGILYLQHRLVVEELFESDFGSSFARLDSSDVIVLCLRIVRLQDLRLCRLIFGGDSKKRKQLLTRLSRYLHFSELGELEEDFWKAFMEEILANDDERRFFKDIFQ